MSVALDAPVSIRRHPALAEVFVKAEARHFSDAELREIEQACPNLSQHVAAARLIREKAGGAVRTVVREIFTQYAYEKHHDHADSKCQRDVNYVVAYATHAMVSNDGRWFEDKLLIWLKTILQAFEFPPRLPGAGGMFPDRVLEERLKRIPQKAQSVYHTYYLLDREMEKVLSPDAYRLIAPYLQLATDVLAEDY